LLVPGIDGRDDIPTVFDGMNPTKHTAVPLKLKSAPSEISERIPKRNGKSLNYGTMEQLSRMKTHLFFAAEVGSAITETTSHAALGRSLDETIEQTADPPKDRKR
jgi:hypothetical protein